MVSMLIRVSCGPLSLNPGGEWEASVITFPHFLISHFMKLLDNLAVPEMPFNHPCQNPTDKLCGKHKHYQEYDLSTGKCYRNHDLPPNISLNLLIPDIVDRG